METKRELMAQEAQSSSCNMNQHNTSLMETKEKVELVSPEAQKQSSKMNQYSQRKEFNLLSLGDYVEMDRHSKKLRFFAQNHFYDDSVLGKRLSTMEGYHRSITYKYLDNEITTIDEIDVLKNNITKAFKLLDYLKKQKVHSAGIPVEIILNGSIIDEEEDIESLQTTSKLPIRIVYKYIKYNKQAFHISTEFFTQRDINFNNQIFSKKAFNSCLQEISDQDYELKGETIDYIHNALLLNQIDGEKSVCVQLHPFLHAAIKDEEQNKIQIKYKSININLEDHDHEAEPVGIVLNCETEQVLLVLEASGLSIEQATLKNFEQLRSFALSHLEQPKYVYGLATTLTKWIFCCYVVPQGKSTVTSRNFLTSEVIWTDSIDGRVPNEFIVKIVKRIRGFLSKEVDDIVEEKVNLFMKQKTKAKDK